MDAAKPRRKRTPGLAKLTGTQISRASRPGLYSDGGGLYLRVKPDATGDGVKRSWIFVYFAGELKLRGKGKKPTRQRREMGLGACDTMLWERGAEAARRTAGEYRALVREGGDPIALHGQRARIAKDKRGEVRTFKECATAYIRLHQKTWANAKHVDQWTNTLNTYAYPIIGACDIRAITRADVLRILEPIWHEKTETATRVRSRIFAVLNWSADRDYCAPYLELWNAIGPKGSALPKAGKLLRAKKRNHPAAPWSAVPGILAAVRAGPCEAVTKAAFTVGVLCASRSGEIRGATWQEFDLTAALWTIPGARMKAGAPHTVPLSSQAVAALQSLPKGKPDALVFPGTRSGKALSDATLTKVLRDMGTPSTTRREPPDEGSFEIATFHGFRSSFRDWVAECTSTPADVAEQCLAHTIGNAVEQAYKRTEYLEKRRIVMQQWADFCVPGLTP